MCTLACHAHNQNYKFLYTLFTCVHTVCTYYTLPMHTTPIHTCMHTLHTRAFIHTHTHTYTHTHTHACTHTHTGRHNKTDRNNSTTQAAETTADDTRRHNKTDRNNSTTQAAETTADDNPGITMRRKARQRKSVSWCEVSQREEHARTGCRGRPGRPVSSPTARDLGAWRLPAEGGTTRRGSVHYPAVACWPAFTEGVIGAPSRLRHDAGSSGRQRRPHGPDHTPADPRQTPSLGRPVIGRPQRAAHPCRRMCGRSRHRAGPLRPADAEVTPAGRADAQHAAAEPKLRAERVNGRAHQQRNTRKQIYQRVRPRCRRRVGAWADVFSSETELPKRAGQPVQSL